MRFPLQISCGMATVGLMFVLSGVAHSDSLSVKTPQGKVHGKTINDGKVKAFLGLPYAAPPVGELRWKAPQAAGQWKGVRDATMYGPRCAQNSGFEDMIFQDSGPSEDCLYLNVYAPAGAKAKSKLPVMFWIHGGGYAAGASSEPRHNGDFLPTKGVVLVTINYRLGVFGFLATSRTGQGRRWFGRELRPDGHDRRARLGECEYREIWRRSRECDHLRRERGLVCGEHADGVATGAGPVSKRPLAKAAQRFLAALSLGGETVDEQAREGDAWMDSTGCEIAQGVARLAGTTSFWPRQRRKARQGFSGD